ncbi:chlorohydrolase [Streptococcus pneumoniae]|nr:chlorohydrolase [Streptococcus pneumoniae]
METDVVEEIFEEYESPHNKTHITKVLMIFIPIQYLF